MANCQFNGTIAREDEAGPVNANFMRLVETCRRYHVDPLAYFTDVFSRIADHPVSRIAELTPYNWAQVRRMKPPYSASGTHVQ